MGVGKPSCDGLPANFSLFRPFRLLTEADGITRTPGAHYLSDVAPGRMHGENSSECNVLWGQCEISPLCSAGQ